MGPSIYSISPRSLSHHNCSWSCLFTHAEQDSLMWLCDTYQIHGPTICTPSLRSLLRYNVYFQFFSSFSIRSHKFDPLIVRTLFASQMTLNNREAITELNAKIHFQKTSPLSVVDVAFARAACYFTQDFKEMYQNQKLTRKACSTCRNHCLCLLNMQICGILVNVAVVIP